MFGKNKNKISPEVQSMIDKTIMRQVPKQLQSTMSKAQHFIKSLREQTELIKKLTIYIDGLEYRIEKLEEFLKVEFVEEKVAEYKKIKKTK